jgi:hypothetical protein
MVDLLQPTHLAVIFFLFGILLIPTIFYILTLQHALEKCAPSSRTLAPGMVWLLLVPLVNMVWHFIVVTGTAQTLANEFRRRSLPSPEPLPGQSIGMAMCICSACRIVPIIGLLAILPYLVLWIIYWVKIAEYSRSLSVLPQPVLPAAAS